MYNTCVVIGSKGKSSILYHTIKENTVYNNNNNTNHNNSSNNLRNENPKLKKAYVSRHSFIISSNKIFPFFINYYFYLLNLSNNVYKNNMNSRSDCPFGRLKAYLTPLPLALHLFMLKVAV